MGGRGGRGLFGALLGAGYKLYMDTLEVDLLDVPLVVLYKLLLLERAVLRGGVGGRGLPVSILVPG